MIYSLAINEEVMNEIMVKGTTVEKSDLIKLALEFLENGNPDLALKKNSWNLVRVKDFEGNLNEIQQLFMTPKQTLRTDNTKSLLNQLTEIGAGNDQAETETDIKLKTSKESRYDKTVHSSLSHVITVVEIRIIKPNGC